MGAGQQHLFFTEDGVRVSGRVGPGTIQTYQYLKNSNVPDMIHDVLANKDYLVISDERGSVRVVFDPQKNAPVQVLNYDEFGKVTLDTKPGFQPFGFAGGIYDHFTGLTHFGARQYDAESGRWLSRDPIGFAGGSTNLYSYVLNDPVNLVDPTGLYFVYSSPAAATAVTNAIANASPQALAFINQVASSQNPTYITTTSLQNVRETGLASGQPADYAAIITGLTVGSVRSQKVLLSPDALNDPSLLFHELVHVGQLQNGQTGNLNEAQAYGAQSLYNQGMQGVCK